MAHNGYFYPDDIIITVVDGVRSARIGFELPTIWTHEACAASYKVDFLTGWEMARMAYRDAKTTEWMRSVHPRYVEERELATLRYSEERSFLLKCAQDGILVNTPEYRKCREIFEKYRTPK